MPYYVIDLKEDIIAKVSSQHVQVDKILARTGVYQLFERCLIYVISMFMYENEKV